MHNAKKYLDQNLPLEERVSDLVSRMSLEEKVSQMMYNSSAIPHLGLWEYNWWNECLHGVARAGVATVFPQSIGMAATFNPQLLKRVGQVISDEARAKHHESLRHGDRQIYKGLTFWSPNINIFRDPRWGRGQETYGEDPYLTGRLGVAFIQGLQGEHPQYLKVAACAKHYAAHSGPEPLRHEFNAEVSPRDLYETYLPAFEEAVKEGKVESVMGAYNRVNGEPCCASDTLLTKILRRSWGFSGHVVSDCSALVDLHKHHKVTSTPEESAALAVKNGCDLNCGQIFPMLLKAVEHGLVSEDAITQAVTRLMRTRMKLGMFDPEEQVPYAQIPYEIVNCQQHQELAKEVALESMVLLKNNHLLPLDKNKIENIAVIGPNADRKAVLLGNYNGTPADYVTALRGIRAKVASNTRVYYAEGCELQTPRRENPLEPFTRGFAESIAAAKRSDVVVMCLGISPELEGEEGDSYNSDAGGDRASLTLPQIQEDLLKAILDIGKPVVLVLFNGSPLTVQWAHEKADAIIEAWYPGEKGGEALADVLFGDYNPAGRLPITYVQSVEQLPPFTDYSMVGRTYRYLTKEPLYPFGYGLSYTDFSYSNLRLDSSSLSATVLLEVEVEVKNSGAFAGDEVVQLYIKHLESEYAVPNWQLQGVKRVHLAPEEKTTVSFSLTEKNLSAVTEGGERIVPAGPVEVFVGGQQPDTRSTALTGKQVLKASFTIR